MHYVAIVDKYRQPSQRFVLNLYALHGLPSMQVQVRKEIETTSDEPPVTHCKIYAGVAWHKSAGFQKKITKNILRYMTQFLKDYSELVKKVASVAPPEVMD